MTFCLECIIIHGVHLAWAGRCISMNGDDLDWNLIKVLTLYSMIGYFIVGQIPYPVAGFTIIQTVMGLTFLAYSKRESGNAAGIIFTVLAIIGWLALMGIIPSSLGQRFSFNYWHISSLGLHLAIGIAWVKSNGTDNFVWHLDDYL